MKPNKSTQAAFVGLVVWLLVSAAPTTAQSLNAIKSTVRSQTLSNGMKIIVMERHDAPVVSFHVYADAGSANESYGTTGISHLLEHMAFKGTQSIGTSNYDKEKELLKQMDQIDNQIKREKAKPSPYLPKLEALRENFEALRLQAKEYVITDEWVDLMMAAGDNNVNAMTNNDATQYINALPSNKVEFWMSMTYDRFANPVFREFYKERDVVMEERRLGTEGQPFGRLIEDFFAVAFKAHPYHHSVVGHMSDLGSITRRDLYDYFRRYYGPSNLTVAIVGDVGATEVFRLAELYFGRLPAGPKPEAVRTVEPEQWGERRVSVEMPSQPAVILGYHRPSVNHSDHFALEALADILGSGRSSRLNRALVTEQRIAIETGAFNEFPGSKFPHLVAVYAIPSQGKTSQECLEAIDLEIDRIKTDSVTLEELDKYRQTALKSLIDQMKPNGSMARLLTFGDVVLGSWERIFDQADQIRALSPEDVGRVANLYLVKTNRTIGELVPAKTR